MKSTIMNLKNKPLTQMLALTGTLSLLTACSTEASTTTASSDVSTTEATVESTLVSDSNYSESNSTAISFSDQTITVDGSGAAADGSILTITQPGTYILSGTLSEGQVRVETVDEADVQIVLDGATITNSTGAAIYVKSANSATITLAEGTINTLSDGETYTFEDSEDEPDATLFSKSDLILNGTGTLVVDANYAHAIKGKDDVTIAEGIYEITSVGDAIKGSDSLFISSGTFTIDAGGDGLQSTNEEEEGKGTLSIESGTFAITAASDGIQAATDLQILGGDFTITTGGGSANSSTASEAWGTWAAPAEEAATTTTEETTSAKGLKATGSLAISGGTFILDTSDDSIHTNDTIQITGGDFTIASGDDGIHADNTLTIDDGTININQSYEGIEATEITLNGGEITLTTSDDGINAAGGNDASAVSGRPGENTFTSTAEGAGLLTINGGTLVVNASGDGLDSNGSIEMNDGTVIVNGPTDSMNGTLDYDSTFNMNGGTLIGVGSSGMAMSPSSTSAQSFLFTSSIPLAADEAIQITGPDGEVIMTFEASTTAQSLVFSSTDLVNGSAYTITTGGTVSGESTTGIYEDTSFSGGSSTVDVSATTEASSGQMGGIGGNSMPVSGASVK
ncbi:carbohydrate-binding domain-containing protein [Trichococcus sp. K1Tr]|uniref:carbohydrate-binding domain-containing protein n=1 Tax=Trichococcus sp. K1Tr TaxID=3020847 RepID=UPI00232E0EB2|nr:carbohydrate-binding domain-containing protein [Trichococcus sp. K1Tr]MDB6353171.1 carbohydrate-binding domain-containing protein [Trichococcus sp. K1Tr]